jgi:hypothetical protein
MYIQKLQKNKIKTNKQKHKANNKTKLFEKKKTKIKK